MSLPSLLIGGAVFNHQYCANPESLPVEDILSKAFSSTVTAGIDTSPYYGPSEEIIGGALKKMNVSRNKYFLCTKAGRVRLDEFDYSQAAIRASVQRSCARLGTDYLDICYLHDVEFVDDQGIHGAIEELFKLKEEGILKNVGISGYPVVFLLDICKQWQQRGQPIDAVLSYCNGCLQNTKLFDIADQFHNAGVKYLLNGSILSMSMLRRQPTHPFHPAPESLKKRIDEVAAKLYEEYGIELADVANGYAFSRSFDPDSGVNAVVLGVSSIEELHAALNEYNKEKDDTVAEKVQEWIGDHMGVTWGSGRVE